MIYRLFNIETGRYATEEEMKYLRVNADGVVERLTTSCHGLTGSSILYSIDEEQKTIYYYWQPAPEWTVETWTTITDDSDSLPEESGEYLVLVKDNETIYPNVWSLERDNKFRVSHWLKSIIAWQAIDKYEVKHG